MGNSLSTVEPTTSLITFKEARTYVSDSEFRRISTAFLQLKKPSLNFEDFCIHVLGGARISDAQQRQLFTFCSRGSNELTFENLFTAIVGISRVESVQAAFIEDYNDFSSWGLRPPMLTIPISDSYVSFYEVMSYVTHLSVSEVIELEKVFATICDKTVCKLTFDQWSVALASCFPQSFSQSMFNVLDENGDNVVDFRELVCGLSSLCRGPFPSRLTYLARIWDLDKDGKFSPVELEAMYLELNVPSDVERVVTSEDGFATFADFAAWSLQHEFCTDLYRMALELGHICLGLKPESQKVEFAVVASFEQRTQKLVLEERNIVAASWHREWEKCLNSDETVPPIDNSSIKGNKDDSGWSGKVACISSESGSLRNDLSKMEYIAVSPLLWRAWLRWHGSVAIDSQLTRKFLPAEYFDDGRAQLELHPLDILIMGHDKRKTRDPDGSIPTSPWACAQVSRSMTVDELLKLCRAELRLSDNEARLWMLVRGTSGEEAPYLLDDPPRTLYRLGIKNKGVSKFLLEVRDRSAGVWPEEVRASVTGNAVKLVTSQNSSRTTAVGLVNAGNFCYRNSAVQCLSRVEPLTEFLLSKTSDDVIKGCENTIVRNVVHEYAKLLRDMCETTAKNIAPNAFNRAIHETRLFESGDQHDCQEFTAYLLDSLHSALVKTTCNGEVEIEGAEEKKIEEMSDEEKAGKYLKEFMKTNDSLITSLFAGVLCSRLKCMSCGLQSCTFEVFTTLSLPIGFERTELYQVVVVKRDGSTPWRYGVLMRAESNAIDLKEAVSTLVHLQPTNMALLSFHSHSNTQLIDDDCPLRKIPSSSRLFALEVPDHKQWKVAFHRKLQYNHEAHFLGSTRGFVASRFGRPLVVNVMQNVSGSQLYGDVMAQMSRFMDENSACSSRASDPSENFAAGYPFQLSIVDECGVWCGQCPSLRFCRGCPIRPEDAIVYIPEQCTIAIDWLPIALYLRYNHSQEMASEDHPSVAETWKTHFAPSSLEACLSQFSAREILEAVDCDKCGKAKREKSLRIWSLPLYLIVQLKRFEYVNGQIVKCKRQVNFPLRNLDPKLFVEKMDDSTYNCIAIACHYGQLSSGHFLTYARTATNEKWLLLNDCLSREVNEEEVDQSAAYVLIYERQ